jgi:hypothetical protein
LVLVAVAVVDQNKLAEPQQREAAVVVVVAIRNDYCKHPNYWLLKLSLSAQQELEQAQEPQLETVFQEAQEELQFSEATSKFAGLMVVAVDQQQVLLEAQEREEQDF